MIALVPRVRRLASTRLRPYLLNIWANVKTIATEPHKLVSVLAGSTLAQLVVILALGASLHSVGQHVSIATLITVNTLAGHHRRRGPRPRRPRRGEGRADRRAPHRRWHTPG